LDMEIEVGDKFITVTHAYPDFSITMHCYLCKSINRILELKEHIDLRWLGKDHLSDLDWAEADVPIIEKIREMR